MAGVTEGDWKTSEEISSKWSSLVKKLGVDTGDFSLASSSNVGALNDYIKAKQEAQKAPDDEKAQEKLNKAAKRLTALGLGGSKLAELEQKIGTQYTTEKTWSGGWGPNAKVESREVVSREDLTEELTKTADALLGARGTENLDRAMGTSRSAARAVLQQAISSGDFVKGSEAARAAEYHLQKNDIMSVLLDTGTKDPATIALREKLRGTFGTTMGILEDQTDLVSLSNEELAKKYTFTNEEALQAMRERAGKEGGDTKTQSQAMRQMLAQAQLASPEMEEMAKQKAADADQQLMGSLGNILRLLEKRLQGGK